MANTCFTTITILHDDKDKLKDFFEKVDKWAKTEYVKNGFDCPAADVWWLGNILGNSGLSKYVDDDDKGHWSPNIMCRGTLNSIELQEKQINISTETAWSPMLEMWKLLCDKYLPNAEIYYTADEGGNELYQTNDPDIIGKYYIDIVDDVPEEFDDIAESEFEATEAQVVTFLQKTLHSTETDIKKLLDAYYKSDDLDWVSIHKWETVEISEVIACE